jgi:two-component system, cell cycle sensor histidine kinase and response regulator CckA
MASPSEFLVKTETILLVDDQPTLRQLIRRWLTTAGYTLLEAASADDALAIAEAREGHIDLLLTDIEMPGLNGFDLARRLAATRPDMKILFVSASPPTARPGQTQRSANYLRKPFTLSGLTDEVRRCLDGPNPSEVRL